MKMEIESEELKLYIEASPEESEISLRFFDYLLALEHKKEENDALMRLMVMQRAEEMKKAIEEKD